MPIHDELGTRMKEYYEIPARSKLIRRMPVIIRVDGKAFHTFTRGFQKPFDPVMIKCMQETTKYLCENIQGCVLGYVQSDEISLLLVDYKRHNSSAWFDYDVMKICSISASMATAAFNKIFSKVVEGFIANNHKMVFGNKNITNGEISRLAKLQNVYERDIDKGAMFDARCFNIPKEEVTNYFYWRQLDATRNSIEMVGHANFSTKELHKKSCNDIQDMLHEQKGINWNDFSVPEKRGTCCIKKNKTVTDEYDVTTLRSEWVLDKNIPIFKGEDRAYVDSRFIGIEED